VRRTVLLYGLLGGVLVAAIFAALGIWLGRGLVPPSNPTLP
jgi:hypothetical protein